MILQSLTKSKSGESVQKRRKLQSKDWERHTVNVRSTQLRSLAVVSNGLRGLFTKIQIEGI